VGIYNTIYRYAECPNRNENNIATPMPPAQPSSFISLEQFRGAVELFWRDPQDFVERGFKEPTKEA